MIKLYDGKLTDLLQGDYTNDPQVQALAYAVLQEKRRLIDLAKGTRTLAVVEELPEQILDLLSVELRTPFYDEKCPIETKRNLIKRTFIFYQYMGTPEAVNLIIQTIFGNGGMEEWFKYGGNPHCFRVRVRNNDSDRKLEGVEGFTKLIASVKRLSSWLDVIIITIGIGPVPDVHDSLCFPRFTLSIPFSETRNFCPAPFHGAARFDGGASFDARMYSLFGFPRFTARIRTDGERDVLRLPALGLRTRFREFPGADALRFDGGNLLDGGILFSQQGGGVLMFPAFRMRSAFREDRNIYPVPFNGAARFDGTARFSSRVSAPFHGPRFTQTVAGAEGRDRLGRAALTADSLYRFDGAASFGGSRLFNAEKKEEVL